MRIISLLLAASIFWPTVSMANRDLTNKLIYATDEEDFAEVRRLLRRGADIHARNSDNINALIAACLNVKPDILEYFLENHVNMRKVQDFDTNYCIFRGSYDHLRLLNEHGFDIKYVNPDGRNALMFAMKDPSAVQYLIDQGIDVNHQDNNGFTALIYAIMADSQLSAIILVENGVNPFIKDHKGRTAIDVAIQTDKRNFIRIIEDSKFFKKDTPPNRKRQKALNEELVEAAKSWDVRATRRAIENGADVNTTYDLIGSQRPLFVTVMERVPYSKTLEIARLFVKNGVDLEKGDVHKRSPLNFIVYQSRYDERYLEAIKFLLKNGADPNSRDHLGNTPLFYASEYLQESIVDLLLQYNADPDIRNNKGQRSYDYAGKRRNADVNKVRAIRRRLSRASKSGLGDKF